MLEKAIDEYVQEMVSTFLYEISHKYNVDICNFQNRFSEKYLTLEDFEKIHWNEIYPSSYFKVKVTGKIENSGMFSRE